MSGNTSLQFSQGGIIDAVSQEMVLGRIDNWRNSRALSRDSGFFYGEHEIEFISSTFCGLSWSAFKSTPVPIAGRPSQLSSRLLLGRKGCGFQPLLIGATMAKSIDASLRHSVSVSESSIPDSSVPTTRTAQAKRKSISKKTRFEVFKRDSFKCQYCGASAPEAILVVDHINPFSQGGADEVTNYITACHPCNAGKSDRKLSDNTTVQKQKAQLDELNERRIQLEMMMQWRNGLKDIDDDQIEILRGAWDAGTPGWSLNDSGVKELRVLFKKYGLSKILDAIEIAINQYIKTNIDGKTTVESVGLAWEKIGGILRVSSMPDAQRELYYIKGILRNRMSYVPVNIIQKLQDALADGLDVEDIKDAAKTARSWTQFRIWLSNGKEVS